MLLVGIFLLDFLGFCKSLCLSFSRQFLGRLFVFFLPCDIFFGMLSIGSVANFTEDLIIIIKDITDQLTGGDQELILPDVLDEGPENNLILFGDSLILFNLFIEFDDMGEKLLYFL